MGHSEAPTKEATHILDGLNAAQKTAVEATDGPVLIVAGPGSGKTRVLTARMAYLLATGQARPYEILALTFTNKAAREMQERVHALVSKDAGRGMWLGTFHSIFARLLRRDGEHLGFTRDFSIYDTDDTERVLRQLMERLGVDKKHYSPRSMRSIISGAKNAMISPAALTQDARGPFQEKAAQLYGPYQQALQRANALDFDDLLLKPLELFQKKPSILRKYQQRWTHVHIDEYQDTNRAQYLLAKAVADEHKNICVVGDDAQSIYAFRGADITNILSFQRDYPDAKVVRLEQNYRSTKNILRLADSVIKNNTRQLKKDLWTNNGDGEPIRLLRALSEKDEAQKAERIIRQMRVRHGYSYNDFAILYRTNAQSRSFEEALRREGVPYRLVGGLSFYQRKEIKDALAYLRLLVNPHDLASLRRIINYPTRGIGHKTQDIILKFASRHAIAPWRALERLEEVGLSPRAHKAVASFHALLRKHIEMAGAPARVAKALLQEAGLNRDLRKEHTQEGLMRWENVQELISAIAEYSGSADEDASLSGFLQEISLLTDADAADVASERVTLMTLHASKGLEFPVVFIGGMEEGLFPLQSAERDRDSMEEERRLFYVGATRAKGHLYLAHARTRYRYGKHDECKESRFLKEIDPAVLATGDGRSTHERWRGGAKSKSARSFAARRTPFLEDSASILDIHKIAAGVRVRHNQFGEGKVVATSGRGDRKAAIVFFKEIGQKKLMLRMAKLRVVE